MSEDRTEDQIKAENEWIRRANDPNDPFTMPRRLSDGESS